MSSVGLEFITLHILYGVVITIYKESLEGASLYGECVLTRIVDLFVYYLLRTSKSC